MDSYADVQSALTMQPHPLIFMTVSGSHQFGFSSHDSDIDLRGVHVLPIQLVAGLHIGNETIEHTTEGSIPVDIVTHDVAKFCRLLLGKNGNVLENIYSPLVIHTSPAHEELMHLASQCITKYHSKHYDGFALKQWKLLQQEHQRNRKGVKALLYLYRVLLTGIHLMQTGRVEANLLALNEIFNLPYIPDLVARKLAGNEHDALSEQEVKMHTAEYHRLCEALDNAYAVSTLPEKVSENTKLALNTFVLKSRYEHADS